MTSHDAGDQKNQKRCFVVMGFGIKTDLATGRKLNLDKSYQALIKPVIESKGIVCVRADEIKHSDLIDFQMFQHLFSADVVIADLSTANVNAFYELGIRHALRPRTTIIVSEEQLSYPFDINHIPINKYTHLGENIDYFEVMRFQKSLGETLDSVLSDEKPDSPVYTFLDNLVPPSLREEAQSLATHIGEALSDMAEKKEDETADKKTLALIIKQAEEAVKNKQFDLAKSLFSSALLMSHCDLNQKISSSHYYLIQRLAYTTYKAKQPDEISALQDALKLLGKIDLDHTNDSETVALAGGIEKNLFQNGLGNEHLTSAVVYFQRAFFLLHNGYNGINLAFLLNCRADTPLDETTEDKIADMVWASRIRRDVLSICEREWDEIVKRENTVKPEFLKTEDIAQTEIISETDEKFWILVNKAEAYFGLGQFEEYSKVLAEAKAIKHEPWMMKSFTDQLEVLTKLLEKNGHLLNPQWKKNNA